MGADGFGMAEENGRWIKIPQLGRVIVGADVEIGANTTIDRGAIDDTVIGDDVKIDNQVQIGHNCRHRRAYGDRRLRRHRGLRPHRPQLQDRRRRDDRRPHRDRRRHHRVGGATQVYDSIHEPGVYTASFPALPHKQWRHVMSELRRLRELAERVRALERGTHGPLVK